MPNDAKIDNTLEQMFESCDVVLYRQPYGTNRPEVPAAQ